jgi:signal transduction histidine kinase
MKHANGEWHWFLRRESVFTWTAEGKPHLVLGTSRDITAQKQTQALSQQLDNEKQRVQLLSHFIHDTSHDFRTPITIMRSSIELLKRMPDRDTQLEKIAKIEHYLDYLVLLLDQHQYMALLDSESALSMSLTDINSIVSAVVENARARPANKTLNFNLDLQSPLPKVMCDISTISRAVSNLLDNATAFTPEGGSITARTRQDQQHVIIEISDTGKGISETDMDHIFERLYKGDDARGLSTGGAGLGLPIVKRIVELHQGDIEISSAVGEGSTFRLILPLSPASV